MMPFGYLRWRPSATRWRYSSLSEHQSHHFSQAKAFALWAAFLVSTLRDSSMRAPHPTSAAPCPFTHSALALVRSGPSSLLFHLRPSPGNFSAAVVYARQLSRTLTMSVRVAWARLNRCVSLTGLRSFPQAAGLSLLPFHGRPLQPRCSGRAGASQQAGVAYSSAPAGHSLTLSCRQGTTTSGRSATLTPP